MPLFTNETRRKLAAGGLAIGFGVHHLRSVATAMMAKAGGHDWLFLDMEHGALSVHDVTQICVAALPCGITPIVRVCKPALDEGARCLDNGAQGIVVPHVDTPEEARRIADAFRYPPRGHRSWGGPTPIYGFQPPGSAEAQAAINDEVLVVAMIESEEGVANAEAMAAVEGIDALLIGTNDLAADMGIPGGLGDARVVAAYETVLAGCRKHGKVLGMGGIYDTELATRYVKLGARLVLGGGDQQYIVAGGRARTDMLRGLV